MIPFLMIPTFPTLYIKEDEKNRILPQRGAEYVSSSSEKEDEEEELERLSLFCMPEEEDEEEEIERLSLFCMPEEEDEEEEIERRSLFCKPSKRVISVDHSFQLRDITDLSSWPALNETELDASQLKALQMALTQEIAVIQGPPGTGKTYIGLKIVEALLENKNIWISSGTRSPILIMCFTSHALDQFLEGILDSPHFKDKPSEELKLVRIGGRSQFERLNEFNLKCFRGNTYLPHDVLREKREAQSAVEADLRGLNKVVYKYMNVIPNKYIPLSELKKYDCISPDHEYNLFVNLITDQQCFCALEIWLQIFIIVNYEEKLQTAVIEPPRAGNTQEEQGSQLQGSESLQTADESSGALNSLQKQDYQLESSQKLDSGYEPLSKDKIAETIDEGSGKEVDFIDMVGVAIIIRAEGTND